MWNNFVYANLLSLCCVEYFELLFNTLQAVSAYVLYANIYFAINQVKDFIFPHLSLFHF